MTLTIHGVIALGRLTDDQREAARAKPWAIPTPDPDEMNPLRAEFAEVALEAFIDVTNTDRQDALVDLLCDLRHWCDREGYDMWDALVGAACHYKAETEPCECDENPA